MYKYQMNQESYDTLYGFSPKRRTAADIFKKGQKSIARDYCSSEGIKKVTTRRLPVLAWLPNYKLRENVLSDLLAGSTLGIYNIPQGLAYSVLASLAPVYGLYASFFPPLLYFILGSSLHSSIGVFSLTCLMVGRTRTSILPDFANGTTATEYHGITDLTPVDVVVALAFLTGTIQLVMALLQLDFLCAYLSDATVSGLTFGAAIHALVAQIPGILGISTHTENREFLKLFFSMANIVDNLHTINWATAIISTITITSLLISKIFIEPKTLKRAIPFPSELITLIIGTVVSRLSNLHGHYNVEIIQYVPTGMPSPVVPRFALMPYLVREAFSIALVAFAVTVSMGKLFAKKRNYRIDPNQELLALGAAGCVSSFFSVFPCSTSLSRTLVNEASGAKTQISGLVSSLLILCVILWIGPLMEPLPMCVLSSIVTVALRSLLMKIQEVPRLWVFSKTDVITWIGTAVVTICYDIIQGLLAGIVIGLILVVYRSQQPGFHVLGEVRDGEYRVKERYSQARETSIMVLRFDAPLIFTNSELFLRKVRKHVKLIISDECKEVSMENGKNAGWRAVVLDCGTWTHTDAMGVEAIKELNTEMVKKKVLVLFADLKSSVRIQYAKAGLFHDFSENQFFPSIAEAITAATLLEDDNFIFRPIEIIPNNM